MNHYGCTLVSVCVTIPRDTDVGSRVNERRWSGYGNCRIVEGGKWPPPRSFDCCVVRPRGLTQWLLAVSGISFLCTGECLGLSSIDRNSSLRLRSSIIRKKEEQSDYLQQMGPTDFRPDWRGISSGSLSITEIPHSGGAHEAATSHHSLSHFSIPDVKGLVWQFIRLRPL